MRTTRRGARRLHRALAGGGRVRLTFRIAVRDAAGNRATSRVRLRLRA
jgi:hypothetical protein